MNANELVVIAQQILMDATGAGTRVYSPKTTPTWDGDYPLLIVECNRESGTSLGSTGPASFDVTATLTVIGRVQALAQADDVGGAVVQMALDELRDQIKRAVINHTALWQAGVQEFVSFDCSKKFGSDTDAQHNGEIEVQIGIRYYQGECDFFQDHLEPLDRVVSQIHMPNGTTRPGADINHLYGMKP